MAGAVNYVVSTKISPASGWCLRGSLISVVPLLDDPYAWPPLDLPGAPQQHARGFFPRCPFVHPSTTSRPGTYASSPLLP
jgi:hypothetical protein